MQHRPAGQRTGSRVLDRTGANRALGRTVCLCWLKKKFAEAYPVGLSVSQTKDISRGLWFVIGMTSWLVLLLMACAPTDTPIPPASIVATTPTQLPSPTPVASTPTPTPPQTLTATPTSSATATPVATPTIYTFMRQRDSLPSRTPTNSPSPTPSPPRPPTATLTPTPEPLPSATPTLSLHSWRGEYFDNPSLAGTPVLIRDDPNLDFNWILDSPAPGIPADNFTVRWTRPLDFGEDGDYRFFADADDGVKLYVDGWLVIDEWNTDQAEVHSGVFADIQRGIHTVTVEYFESGGYARIKVWVEKTTLVEDNWIGEYYDNSDLKDPAFLVRQDSDINFDWDKGSPTAGLAGNHFSVRWRRTLYFTSGDYRFQAEIADKDTVRIYLDGWLVAEGYEEDGGTVSGAFNRLGAGLHTLTVEYQEDTGRAKIKFTWAKK